MSIPANAAGATGFRTSGCRNAFWLKLRQPVYFSSLVSGNEIAEFENPQEHANDDAAHHHAQEDDQQRL